MQFWLKFSIIIVLAYCVPIGNLPGECNCNIQIENSEIIGVFLLGLKHLEANDNCLTRKRVTIPVGSNCQWVFPIEIGFLWSSFAFFDWPERPSTYDSRNSLPIAKPKRKTLIISLFPINFPLLPKKDFQLTHPIIVYSNVLMSAMKFSKICKMLNVNNLRFIVYCLLYAPRSLQSLVFITINPSLHCVMRF